MRQEVVSLHTSHPLAENSAGSAPRTPTQNLCPLLLRVGGESLSQAGGGSCLGPKMSAPRPRTRPGSFLAPRRPLATAAHPAALRCGGRSAEERMRTVAPRFPLPPSQWVDRRMHKEAWPRSPPPSLGACARRGLGNRQKGRGRNTLPQARAALGAGQESADSGASR